MNKQQILEKAIQKAIDGGWKPGIIGDFMGVSTNVVSGERFGTWKYKDINPYGLSVAGIIFNHDFAKALWSEGTGDIIFVRGKAAFTNGYRFHLQQMVIAKNPIKYLSENI